MERYNLQLAQVNNQLDSVLHSIPIGVAYFILKNKVIEYEGLYNQQIQLEFEDYQKEMQKQQEEEKQSAQGQA